jgi:hypothetical protein
MAKTSMRCPFTDRLCTECAPYRGRHYYLCFCKQYRGYIGESKKNGKSDGLHHSADLQAFRNWVAPWAGASSQPETELDVKLKVTDMESGETRLCELSEAKTWDWSNPEMMRVIDGLQITSWDKLVEFLSYKVEKGYREVEIYEAHRFMLMGGG